MLARTLLAVGASKPERVARGRLLILTFHRVLPDELRKEYPLPGLAVTPEELHWILSELLPHFELMTVSDAVRRLRHDRAPRPLIAVSFDDGQWDNLEYAAPVLKALDVRATFYVPTDYVGKTQLLWHDRAAFAWQMSAPDVRASVIARSSTLSLNPEASVAAFLEAVKRIDPQTRATIVERLSERVQAGPSWARLMTWQEVMSLRQAGHEIGSHSCSHALLPQLDDAAQRAELLGSMNAIKEALGEQPKSLCYPNGSFDSRSVAIAKELGYENAVTTRWGLNDRQHAVYELLRCDMDAKRVKDRHGNLSLARLTMRIAGYQPGL